MRVLIIESDVNYRRFISSIFMQQAFEVVDAGIAFLNDFFVQRRTRRFRSRVLEDVHIAVEVRHEHPLIGVKVVDDDDSIIVAMITTQNFTIDFRDPIP